MIDANLSWDEYITFINEPKHLVNPIRDIKIFDSWYLEMFTRTPWYFIPLAFIVPYLHHAYQAKCDVMASVIT
jgi:hypothetical protein